MNETVFNFLLEGVSSDIVGYLLADNTDMDMAEAISLLYNSELYNKLSNPDTGLYFESSAYNYELLKHELKYGCMV